MGHGSRRLQRERRRVGLFSARSRALASISLGGRRHRGHSATATSTSVSRLALWNEKDPILKERLFGLTNREGNHGEDVKEYYYYLDATPTSSYLQFLYKYPHAAFPYDKLREENAKRTRHAAGIRADRYRSVQRESLFRHFRGVRESHVRRHCGAHHRLESRPGTGTAASAPYAMVPQSLGLGRSVRRTPQAKRVEGSKERSYSNSPNSITASAGC